MSDERKLAELWGEDLPRQPMNARQQRVSGLPPTLGPAMLIRRSAGYVLDLAAEDVDAITFAREVLSVRRAMATAEWPAPASAL